MSEINQRVMGKDPIVTTGSEQRLAKKSEIDNYYKKLIDLGVVNSNAKIGEFEDLLKDSVNGQSGNFLSKIPIGPKTDLLQVARNTQNRYMGKLYQGSDDVWKTYSWEMELGKLKNVFKKDPNATISLRDAKSRIELSEQGINPDAVRISQFDKNIADDLLEREAAQIVKDTVPNYARVPEFITKLRRLPFGNFIAFPAEILRTNTNILHQAVREIASESPEIRSIGMRRLTGSLSVNGGIGATLTTAGQLLTGTDRDQINAWKRSVAADWDKNSILIPIASDKDGKITEMYNFSYTNPYDYALRPARAFLQCCK